MIKSPISKKRKFFSYIFLLLLLFFIFTLFLPMDVITLRAIKLGFMPDKTSKIVFFGNSVMGAPSNCDSDRSSIAKMLETRFGKPVIDLSRGGQQLDFSLGNAGLVISGGYNRVIIVPISLFQLNSSNTYPVWTSLLFQLATGGLEVSSLSSRFQQGAYISGATPRSQQSFVYNQREYPEHAQLKATYFSREKNQLTCPSRLGVDLNFIEANYYRTHILAPTQKKYFIDLKKIQTLGKQRKSQVIYVLLPINFEDINFLNSELASAIEHQLLTVRESLDSEQVEYLDLSKSLHATDFADRFCACGHLNQDGRNFVAAQINTKIVGTR